METKDIISLMRPVSAITLPNVSRRFQIKATFMCAFLAEQNIKSKEAKLFFPTLQKVYDTTKYRSFVNTESFKQSHHETKTPLSF